MPGAQQPPRLPDLFPKAMGIRVPFSSHQCSCLLVEAEERCSRWPAPLLPASLLRRGWRYPAPPDCRCRDQGRACSSYSWVLLGRRADVPFLCRVTPTLSFFGQYARVRKRMDMDEHACLQCELRGKYKSVREEVGVDVHTPYRYAHANSTSETEQRDRRCLRSETPSETNVLPPDVPRWLFLVWQSTLEMAGKRFSQHDFSLQSRARETELFHSPQNVDPQGG